MNEEILSSVISFFSFAVSFVSFFLEFPVWGMNE